MTAHFAFTPGPWEIVAGSNSGMESAIGVAAEDYYIADVWGDVDHLKSAAQANAALIAAAPDMLAALNRVTEALFSDAVNGHALPNQAVTRKQLGELYEIAHAAITRATGAA